MDKDLTVAAFDFDGTITYCDTLIPYLVFVAGKLSFAKRLAPLIPQYLAYKCGRISNQVAKEAFLSAYLKGLSYAQMQSLGEEFSKAVLPKLVRSQMSARISWHKSQRHTCILVSASLDVYLKAWALLNGFDGVISSQLETDSQGFITGKINGRNCYGEEKARRLKDWLSTRKIGCLYGYGDSRGDLAMLQVADVKWYKGKPLDNSI